MLTTITIIANQCPKFIIGAQYTYSTVMRFSLYKFIGHWSLPNSMCRCETRRKSRKMNIMSFIRRHSMSSWTPLHTPISPLRYVFKLLFQSYLTMWMESTLLDSISTSCMSLTVSLIDRVLKIHGFTLPTWFLYILPVYS